VERVGSSAAAPSSPHAPPSSLARGLRARRARGSTSGAVQERDSTASPCSCAWVELAASTTLVIRPLVLSAGSAQPFLLSGGTSTCLPLPPRRGGARRRRASEREARQIQPLVLPAPHPLLLPLSARRHRWQMHSRREEIHFYLTSLLAMQTDCCFASSVGAPFGDAQCRARGIYAFAQCCWTQSKDCNLLSPHQN
jgi:hypothetical protein